MPRCDCAGRLLILDSGRRRTTVHWESGSIYKPIHLDLNRQVSWLATIRHLALISFVASEVASLRSSKNNRFGHKDRRRLDRRKELISPFGFRRFIQFADKSASQGAQTKPQVTVYDLWFRLDLSARPLASRRRLYPRCRKRPVFKAHPSGDSGLDPATASASDVHPGTIPI